MDQVSVSQLKEGLSDYINRVAYGQERIVIVSRGKPKAAVIGVDDLERLEELEDAEAVRQALVEHSEGETLTLNELIAGLEAHGDAVSD